MHSASIGITNLFIYLLRLLFLSRYTGLSEKNKNNTVTKTQKIALPGSFFVFVLYWALVFNGSFNLISVFTHGVNFVVMAMDTLFSRQPLRMSHWFYFEVYVLVGTPFLNASPTTPHAIHL
jgi:O-antigen ligase